nr:hypothetical protein [Tanacetum cinerariifolium]
MEMMKMQGIKKLIRHRISKTSNWAKAMKEEMNSLRKNKTWELVDHLTGQRLVSCKWLFKIKEGIKGYEQGNKVRLLKKSFYGLKQSHRQWYKRFDEYMLSNGFKHCNYDNCEFDMKDLRKGKKILGMEIIRDRSHNEKSVKMSLGGHFKMSIKDYSVRDNVVERTSKVSYVNTVGSLMYLMVCKRPDIAYAVSVVSRYLANPGKNH